MVTLSKSHDENRSRVCLFCCGKSSRSKFSNILPGSKLEKLINVTIKYNALDKRVPDVVCDKCRRKLYSSNIVLTANLKQFYDKSHNTRTTPTASNKVCDCKICQIANQGLFEISKSASDVIHSQKEDQTRKFKISLDLQHNNLFAH
jgi:hypothetical protein